MKIAVMADIHSNHLALKRCLDEAEKLGAEEYLFLGDYIGELPCPGKTLMILEELSSDTPCTFIRGNKENYWINHKAGKDVDWEWIEGTSGSGMLNYSYTRLTPAQIDGFEKLPISRKMKYEGMPEFVICHGSPFKVSESMREEYDYIDDLTSRLETELTICAHYHIQSEYSRNSKTVINPGAVGMPLKSGGKTQFMMLYDKDGAWEHEFLTLEYDVEEAIREMDEERLFEKAPAWYRVTKAVLRGKDISQARVIEKADELCRKYEGSSDWRKIQEKYWEMALEYYGI